jgi:hypothetical protein
MGLFNRNQPKKTANKKDSADADDMISDLLSEPAGYEESDEANISKGITLGFDEGLDAGLQKFKKSQANPSDEEAFAQAIGKTGHQQEKATFTFSETETSGKDPSLDAFLPGDAYSENAPESYESDYSAAPPYYIEDHRTPYTQPASISEDEDYPQSSRSKGAADAERHKPAQHGVHKALDPSRTLFTRDSSAKQQPLPKTQGTGTAGKRSLQSFPAEQAGDPAPRYGIADAIKLLRQLPETGDVTVLMTIVKRTLETAGIIISDIIDDAQRHRQDIQGRVKRLETEIKKLEDQMRVRTTEVNNLTAQLTETEQVQELLELAEIPEPTQFEREAYCAENTDTESQLVD